MAFNFFKRLFRRSVLGVDIGTTSIKIVELESPGGPGGPPAGRPPPPELVNYGLLETSSSLERFNTAIQTSTLTLFDQEVVSYLRLMVRKSGVRSRRAIASLPSFSAFTTVLEMPVMSEEDIAKTMNFSVRQYIPMPLSAVTLDWTKVGERVDDEGNRKLLLFLVSVPTALIESYKKIFKAAGLQLAAVEIEGLSLARALTAGVGEPTLVIDIGSHSTALLVIENGMLKCAAQTDIAGASLTHSLASGMTISARRAEALKRQRGLSSLEAGGEQELSTQMAPLLDVILNEARRTVDAYRVNYRAGAGVAAVIVSGGGANLFGIEEYFSRQLGLPVTRADPFSCLEYSSQLEAVRKNLGPPLAAAVGLAMKSFV